MITAVDIRKKTLDVEFFNNFEDNESTEGIPIPHHTIVIYILTPL